MPDRVLLVDDDPNVLQAYARRLRKRFDVETALCSEEGVTAVNILGPFAVVVSDMTMPRENGAEFLSRIIDLAPDSVRIMLTGNADQQAASDAVNVGRVFRFLNKPCPAETLEAAIEAGVEEHRRLADQRRLIGESVNACVAMLTRVLSLADPPAFGRAERIGRLVGEIAVETGVDDRWELETAGRLSQLGVITVPAEIRARVVAGETLNAKQQAAWIEQYRVAAELIGEAPQLNRVAKIVALQQSIRSRNDSVTLLSTAAELLALAIEYDQLTTDHGLSPAEALNEITALGADDAGGLDALKKIVERDEKRRIVELSLGELADGMRLVVDIETTDGTMLVARGQEVTAALRGRLKSYASTHDIKQPIRVLTPPESATDTTDRPSAAV